MGMLIILIYYITATIMLIVILIGLIIIILIRYLKILILINFIIKFIKSIIILSFLRFSCIILLRFVIHFLGFLFFRELIIIFIFFTLFALKPKSVTNECLWTFRKSSKKSKIHTFYKYLLYFWANSQKLFNLISRKSLANI